MTGKLTGQTAIVTGGAKGYGRGIAAALAEAGADVWITGRDEAALDQAAAALGVRATRADVTSGADWDALFESVTGEAGRVDILINNAGAAVRVAPLVELEDEEIESAIAVNLTGAILGCRRAGRVMGAQGSGIIINISSVCQRQAWPGWSVYGAAKAGLGQLSNGLYVELREAGVRVTTLIPSWGATGFLEAANLEGRSPEEAAQCIQPAEIGEMVVAICSLPGHLNLQDCTVWPTVQPVEPL